MILTATACGGSAEDGLYDDGSGGAAGSAEAGGSGGTVETGGSAGGGSAKKCLMDSDCTPLICNWKSNTCQSPGPKGCACARDVECAGGICNWKLDSCQPPLGSGEPCVRDLECQSQHCVGFSCQ